MQIEGHCVDLRYVSFISPIEFTTSWDDPPVGTGRGLQIVRASFRYSIEGREMVVGRQFTSMRPDMMLDTEIEYEIDKLEKVLGPIREEMVTKWFKTENVTS